MLPVFNTIKNILIETNQDKYGNVQECDYFDIDSLTSVKLIVSLETEYDIEIRDEILKDLSDKTILEFSKIIENIIIEKLQN